MSPADVAELHRRERVAICVEAHVPLHRANAIAECEAAAEIERVLRLPISGCSCGAHRRRAT